MTTVKSSPRAGASRPAGSRGLGRGALLAIEIAVPILLIALWWVLSAGSTNPFFPPLSTILVRFQELWLFDHFASDILVSLGNLLLGFAIGVIAGIALGVLLGLSKYSSALLGPVINFWRAIPPVAIVPIIVSLMGFGNETRVLAIALSALFPTLVSTIDGLRSIDSQLKDVARVYRIGKVERLFSIYLPAASPRIASGAQVSLQVSFVVMIASEMLGSSVGIGALTLLAQQSFAIADMWAGILLLGIIGYLANVLFTIARDRVLRWYVQSQRLGKEA